MKSFQYKMAVVVFLIFLSGLSCSKKFLEEPPRQVTIQDLLNNPTDGAQRMIAAVYNKLYDWNVHTFSWIGISSITSDDADKGSLLGDAGTDKDLLDNWTFNASGFSFDEVWVGNYEGIGRACYALQYLPQMELPEGDKGRYIGEAKMLRAYFYWNLIRMFGGVPKVDHVLQSQEEVLAASTRASAEEIYAFIEQDLNDAINSLPLVIPPAEYGRVSKGAAEGLLAKVLMYEKKWAESNAMCDAVINSGQYSLLPDYAIIWREAGEFTSESLWEVNAIGVTPNKGVQQYSSVQDIRPRGWGFNTPTQDLVDAYEAGDKRKDATIMFQGQTLWDGEVYPMTAPNPRYNYKSYFSRTKETYNGNDDNCNKNLRLVRFGEILLIKAEVENELGDTSAAKDALNQIRARAGLGPKFAYSQSILRDAIYKERRVEMAFEHDRMFDLRRTGRAEQVMRAHGKPYTSPKHDLFPIPQAEIDLSGGRLIQNPGY